MAAKSKKKVPRAGPTRATLAKQRAQGTVLAVLSTGRSITAAMAAVGKTRNAFYEWTRTDPDFEARAYEATEAGTDAIEDEALRRAVEGVSKGIFYQGVLVERTKEYSDTLLERLLKARRPDKYKDRTEHGIEKDTLEQLVNASFKADPK